MRPHSGIWMCAVAAGFALCSAVATSVAAQSTTFQSPAVTSMNLPVFYQQLEAQMLKFKLAYKPITSVLKWRIAARAKLYELTLELAHQLTVSRSVSHGRA